MIVPAHQPRRDSRWSNGSLRVQVVVYGALVYLLAGALLEFYNISAGTGNWYADFSAKWLVALILAFASSVAFVCVCLIGSWRRQTASLLVTVRRRLTVGRYMIVAALLVLPSIVLQYTPWGVVFRGPFIRLLIWLACSGAIAWLLTRHVDSVWSVRSILMALLLSGSAVVIASACTQVTDYPFSLGWSEGNRLWDYSLLFGKHLYSFDPAHQPVAYLDIGRQIVGGLPFLLPRVSIMGARAWLAVAATVPYMVTGLLAFRVHLGARLEAWLAAGSVALLFLSQGPIHPPLVICAILVLIAWQSRGIIAIPLMFLAGYAAETSRFTWMFAPAMWAAMLELGGDATAENRAMGIAWRRALGLVAAGLLGSALAFSGVLHWTIPSLGSSASVSKTQALLWYRLLPNATYTDGILLGLLKAAGPLVLVISYVALRHRRPSRLQISIVGGSLLAFLVVGLVISTKIGGGGDLHNLDMFLIGLLLTAALLWHGNSGRILQDLEAVPKWFLGALALVLILPSYAPLLSLQPLSFANNADWIAVLADSERPKDLGSLPDEVTTEQSLIQIRSIVEEAAGRGPVLFMDQRQLLTFGYVQGVELVPEFEKKRMMDEALSGNGLYFRELYEQLAAKRFTLIVSSLLRTPIKDSEYGFGEENNAWVRWVARPVLCYYEELDTLREVKVELLAPRASTGDCSAAIPIPMQ